LEGLVAPRTVYKRLIIDQQLIDEPVEPSD
jgi:hypothetical protein